MCPCFLVGYLKQLYGTDYDVVLYCCKRGREVIKAGEVVPL